MNNIKSMDQFLNEGKSKKKKKIKGEVDKDGWIDEAGLGNKACKKIKPTDGMQKLKLDENKLPRPCPKIKCLECGEEVCDSLRSKIWHLENKHYLKLGEGDYMSNKTVKKYFN